MSIEEQREAIHRAAELSVDHISAWFATGTGNSTFQSMREEIERNMTESLKFHEDCQSAFAAQRISDLEHSLEQVLASLKSLTKRKDQRIATLEAMVKEALCVFDLHLNTPETRALRAQWKEMKGP